MFTQRRIQLIRTIAIGLLRYGLAFVLLASGAAKFTEFEAEAIKPLVENSPFMGWLYGMFSFRRASALIGTVEMTVAVLMGARRWLPRASAYASLAAAAILALTLSFLFTTPGVFEPTSPWGAFIIKDVILLGAALFTSAEALNAIARPEPQGGTLTP